MSLLPPPLVVYPLSVKAGQAPSSQGSFTPVYLAMGIIGALTLQVACFAGWAVARRCLRPRSDKGRVAEAEIKMGVPTVNLGVGVGGINLKAMKHLGSDVQESAAAGASGSGENLGGAFPDHAPGPGYDV